MRILNHYFLVQGWEYSAGWWYFIVVIYVPVGVVLAYPLASVLGLLPKTTQKLERSAGTALDLSNPELAASTPGA
jgi:hypothetical protein